MSNSFNCCLDIDKIIWLGVEPVKEEWVEQFPGEVDGILLKIEKGDQEVDDIHWRKLVKFNIQYGLC